MSPLIIFMKIFYYINDLGLGGTDQTALIFANQLSVDPNYDVTLAVLESSPNQREDQVFDSVNFIKIDKDYLRNTDFSEYDIFHVFRSGYPEFPQPIEDINGCKFVETNVFGFLDPSPGVVKTLFMSKWLKDFALSRIGNHPIVNGDRWDFVNNPVYEITQKPQKLYSRDKIVIGRVGRPDDGIYTDISVKAVKILMDKGYDNLVMGVMAPPPRMVKDMEDLGIDHYVIEPSVRPQDLREAYSNFDIYGHYRADGETFGNSLAESQSIGLPIVTHVAEPSYPGMGVFQSQTELVVNGVTGYVVPNCPEKYAEALEKMILSKDLMGIMGEAGRLRFLREYEASVSIDKLKGIYENI